MTVTFGAIRWDAWYGNAPTYHSFETAATFSDVTPVDWRGRAPAHANLSTNPITWSDSQSTFDNELRVAARGGLDYFAYLIFPAPDAGNMNAALAYHRASSIKTQVKFAVMRSANNFGTTGNFTTQVNDTITYMQDSAYMTVISGRPLLYIYIDTNDIANYWGGNAANFRTMITALRAAAVTAGLLSPYIVSVGGGEDKTSTATYGMDAVSNYTGLIPNVAGAPYQQLDRSIQNYWDNNLTASNIVPICHTGWDPRPRWQNPESFAQIGTNWIISPSISELTRHLAAAKDYVTKNPVRCPAQTVLTYAWSENDEGGVMPGPTVADPQGSLCNAFGAAKTYKNTNMTDYIFKFADEATALADASLAAYHSGSVWDAYRVLRDIKVWQASQDVGNVHTFLTGFYCLVSLDYTDNTLVNHAALQFAISRDSASAGQYALLKSNVGGVLQDLRFSPVFAGSNYPFGNLK